MVSVQSWYQQMLDLFRKPERKPKVAYQPLRPGVHTKGHMKGRQYPRFYMKRLDHSKNYRGAPNTQEKARRLRQMEKRKAKG